MNKFTAKEIAKIDKLVKKINVLHRKIWNGINKGANLHDLMTMTGKEFTHLLDDIRQSGNDVKYSPRLQRYFRKYDENGNEIFCVKRELKVVAHQFVTAKNAKQAMVKAEDEYLMSDGDGELPDPTFEIDENAVW